jgi:RND family efflux transporter MFP subunit
MQPAERGKFNQPMIVAGILLLGIIAAAMLFVFKPVAEKQPAPYQPPEVSYMEVSRQAVRIPVRSQGNIEARIEINLSVEVAGRISHISPLFNDGKFFSRDDLLARIDDRDYKLAITRAEAQVAAAEQALARVQAEAEQARLDIQRMGRSLENASPYALREPHLQEARANLKAARADLALAKLQHKRSFIRAPFDGRVIIKNVDVGEYVTPGMALARIYSTETMELKLPLTQHQLRLVDLPLHNNSENMQPVNVLLETDYAGRTLQWNARLVRTESVIDSRNRLLNAIAQISNKELLQAEASEAALTAGLFVRARIAGKQIENIAVIPRDALHNGDQVWLIRDNMLDIRKVGVLHKDDTSAYIESGLADGDKLITSALDYAIQGMRVAPIN